ncbi:hypothetical protein JZ751_010384, partial [Albula glossodonta]
MELHAVGKRLWTLCSGATPTPKWTRKQEKLLQILRSQEKQDGRRRKKGKKNSIYFPWISQISGQLCVIDMQSTGTNSSLDGFL